MKTFKNYYEKLSVILLAAFITSNGIWVVLNDSNIDEIRIEKKNNFYCAALINYLVNIDTKQDSIIDSMPEMLYPNPDAEWKQ